MGPSLSASQLISFTRRSPGRSYKLVDQTRDVGKISDAERVTVDIGLERATQRHPGDIDMVNQTGDIGQIAATVLGTADITGSVFADVGGQQTI